ncbi:MAG: NAD(P)/FAD-dependent oxidoreductase [Myxococcales bacterium]|nr:NAD(P)/FAD-dependent oxidoreductase [Myxococcales bacterium]
MKYDVAILGGGLVGSMAAVMLQRRGMSCVILESRPWGKEQKVVVGEALTEGSSVFMRHEIGLTDWLKKNAYRKFGFDFLVRPRTGELPKTMEECHELLLSLTPLEKNPSAFSKLIPTFHVERTSMNRHVAELAKAAGVAYLDGASVEQVELGEPHVVHYAHHGKPAELEARWVLDASGRRSVLGRQLGITHPVKSLDTASVWNRFSGVNDDPNFWRTFHGVDRRRHTIHFCGQGFWFWWIHQRNDLTSVGVSFDNEQHQPNVKTDDHGFWEMVAKFPPIADALRGARPLEPYQYYAHLPYNSEHWLSTKRYAIVGDAAWFTDALYSIGIETACRQLAALGPIVTGDVRGNAAVCEKTVATLNAEFQLTQKAVTQLNRFKYKEGWHRPHVVMQTALYELGEIAELYHLQDPRRWVQSNLDRHYRMQWGSQERLDSLVRFQEEALRDGDRDLEDGKLLKKALLPGKRVYRVTWPLWKLPNARPYFFKLTRAWGFAERLAQRYRLFPDGLGWMAADPEWTRFFSGQRPRKDDESRSSTG